MIMILTIYACEFEIEALGTLEPDLIETQSILKYWKIVFSENGYSKIGEKKSDYS